jgi:hypothetical protein
MPNWCENSVEILAKEETIQWIAKNLDENCGRTWDEAATSISYFCKMGDEVWYVISISVRTSGSAFSIFLDLILKTFKNVHFKGYYYIDGGFGGGFYEEGTDEAGNRYQIYTPVPDPYTEYCEEEYYNVIQEVPQEGELLWDLGRNLKPHWYDDREDPPPREEELYYNIYDLLLEEEQTDLDYEAKI